MKLPLSGQVAIVTGGATGIGAGVALKLAERGASVALNYRSHASESEGLLKKIHETGGRAVAVMADVAQPRGVADLVAQTLAAFGRLDIMVANAGIQVDATALEMTVAEWDKAMSVDLRGQFLCAQAAARRFLEQKHDEGISRAAGKIICMLSVHDRIPWMGHVNYATAKAGANMMMQTLAQEWGGKKIRVLGVSPGAIRTDINKAVWSDDASYRDLLKLIPYQRMGEVEEVANVVAWLASDEADYITGTTLYVDGGMTLYPGFMNNG